MYEVIISKVNTGKVTRRQFETLDEAERYVRLHEELLRNPLPPRKPQSLRNYRVEVQYHAPRPVIRHQAAQAA